MKVFLREGCATLQTSVPGPQVRYWSGIREHAANELDASRPTHIVCEEAAASCARARATVTKYLACGGPPHGRLGSVMVSTNAST